MLTFNPLPCGPRIVPFTASVRFGGSRLTLALGPKLDILRGVLGLGCYWVGFRAQLSRFMRFESKLRAKWPQKSAQPVGQPRGPALPGEQTPKTFNIHDWAVATSVKHLRMGELPVSKLKWDDVLATNDMEAVRKIVERCARAWT